VQGPKSGANATRLAIHIPVHLGVKDDLMLVSIPSIPSSSRSWPWTLLTVGLILTSAGLRIAYLAHDCPLDLAPDEAHYWDWSRHLDWSYYSKGPLVAYLIHFSVVVAGAWSERLTGSLMLAVRLPAVACGSLLLLGLYVLTRQAFGRPGLAVGVVAVALTMPVVTAGSTLMTIDAPFTCCWCWALVFGYQAMCRGSKWAWPLAGLAVGLGILAKYTMILWPVSAGLFLLTSPARRRMLLQPGFCIMTILAVACCLPILIWNLEHDWVGVRHVERLAGLNGNSSHIHWLGPVSYLSQQALLHLGFWFAVWLAAMIVYRPWKGKWPVTGGQWLGRSEDGGSKIRDRQAAILDSPFSIFDPRPVSHWPLTTSHYLWWFSAPTFLVFLLFSFKTGGGEPNWPVASYISGLVLGAGWLITKLHSPRGPTRPLTLATLGIACGLAFAVTLFTHNTGWARPLLARISGAPTPNRPLPLRRFDPTCRLVGWRQLAAEVDRLRSQLQAEGTDPLIVAGSWSVPGELAFYCQGHPTVYSLGMALADRHSQYDLWRPNPVLDADCFRGRTMIFVGEISPALRQAFAQVDVPHEVTFFEGAYPLAHWAVTVCRDFRGFGYPAVIQQQPIY
jgi:4-amino-4-deoxy-L-arabinose transferase-like glycosyltransferase